MTKPDEKEQARELRRRGESLKSIARKLEVSPSTVMIWTADITLSAEQTLRLTKHTYAAGTLGRAAMKSDREQHMIAAREEARAEWATLHDDPEFVFGLAIYIGEGAKTSTTVGVTNADPAVLRAALRFFAIIKVDMPRVKVHIILHQGEDPEAALRYWSRELKLPVGQFNRVTTSKVSGGKRATHLIHGTAHVRLSSYRIKWKLNLWMDLAKEHFGK